MVVVSVSHEDMAVATGAADSIKRELEAGSRQVVASVVILGAHFAECALKVALWVPWCFVSDRYLIVYADVTNTEDGSLYFESCHEAKCLLFQQGD